MIALAALLFWPAIPLFWVPVHCLPGFFRRLGLATYLLPVITWLPLSIFLYEQRELMLRYRIVLPGLVNSIGPLLAVLGLGLQVWTLALLTLPGIMGVPEVAREGAPARLMKAGPFSVLRHPTYLSHTMMLAGLFLWTGLPALGVVAVIDFLVATIVIIPLEERELLERFGKEYEEYRKEVPSRFLPFRRKK